MGDINRPRIRGTAGDPPPYPLNRFPLGFAQDLGKRLIYYLCVNPLPKIEGSVWEKIFADSIGAEWVNSPAELDDVRFKNCAWSGKGVFFTERRPGVTPIVRLISGRNNLWFSYGVKVQPGDDPDKVGEMVLNIWNARVSGVRKTHEHLRTVVLLKSLDHSTFSVFEKNTDLYIPQEFRWEWNRNDNLIGFSKLDGRQYFTWQVNGQQFTIHDTVPNERLTFKIKIPPEPDMNLTLKAIGFDETWVEILRPTDL